MAAPLDPAKLDHAIQLYLAGEPVEKIPAASGVSLSRFHRERTARGIPSRRTKVLPVEAIAAAYLNGASEYALAAEYGVSRAVIGRRLSEAGIPRRGPSAAGVHRAAQMTPEQRKRQSAAANRASRMRRLPDIEKFRRALTKEAVGAPESEGETTLATLLTEHGLHCVPQRAIGPYNVDLAMPPIAVEVLGGGWHSFKPRHAERTPYILDQGWHLVMVWDYEGRSSLGAGAAEYLVSFLETIRRHPPATCQYRVVTGQGELLTARGREDDEFPLVPPPRGR